MKKIDVNSDLGESFGAYKMGMDDKLLPLISSANIACGFHGGDPSVMRKTVETALKNNVALGAHPGLPDLLGFGRRNMAVTPQEAYDMTVYQTGALWGFIKAQGGKMSHVKPHGALYNMAAKDYGLAKAIAEAVYDIDPELTLFGLSESELIRAGNDTGLRTAGEVFADRSYQDDGSLTPRKNPGAMITNEEASVAQVLRMALQGEATSLSGKNIKIKADTVCVHGDGEHALAFAEKIREALEEAGIEIKAPYS